MVKVIQPDWSRETMTFAETLGPAMEITNEEEALGYLTNYVDWIVESTTQSMSVGKATEIAKFNLGYYAGYYDENTRKRVEKLYSCMHPVFGSASNPTTAREAFQMGLRSEVDNLRAQSGAAASLDTDAEMLSGPAFGLLGRVF